MAGVTRKPGHAKDLGSELESVQGIILRLEKTN